MTPRELRDAAMDLADIADARTMRAFRHELDVRTKSDGSWVTEVDVAVETALCDEIARRFPTHCVEGEEIASSASAGPSDDGPSVRWIIDPIDGTTNFVRGNPIFATLLAVQVDGVEVAGVVSAPALATRWDAAQDQGTRQDGMPVAVSERRQMRDAEVSFGGLQHLDAAGYGQVVGLLTAATARQRGYGDFWQHCLVASGSTDVALDADVKVWDLAAVKVVVECAGGRFTSFSGEATADSGTGVSSNGHLHDEVLALLARR
ncbi:MAG: inositol monophosphatase family protein [Nitriliruptoraceae bacterium]